jgi:ureidoacrylate peracid hydrolase
MKPIDVSRTALMLVDLQNDFVHPKGAYGRAGIPFPAFAPVPARIRRASDAMRRAGGLIVATLFTLVPGRDGEPLISGHLKRYRPFLGKGDFAPGSFGQAVIDELQPVDIAVEKVAYSAFYQSRLEFVLDRAGIERLVFTGIVTNGGVETTLRDAHLRDYETALLTDCCASFTQESHDGAIAAVANFTELATADDFVAALPS